MNRAFTPVLAGIVLAASAPALQAQTLRGSMQAMQRQNQVALQHDYSFLKTSADVRRFAGAGLLVRLTGNQDYELVRVSYPYARPPLKLFVERLSAQYRAACGEKLVVTSLTRPVREQPRNASRLSVHPAGMAVDLRISRKPACRSWLERTLLSLERQGVVDATRENRPPHYHVAVFPSAYTRYVAALTNRSSSSVAAAAPTAPKPAESRATLVSTAALEDGDVQSYEVNRGDSLWSIARRLGTTVDTLKELNGMSSSTILAGQVIRVPQVAAGADDP